MLVEVEDGAVDEDDAATLAGTGAGPLADGQRSHLGDFRPRAADEAVGGRGELNDSAVVGVRELVPLLLREDAEPERRRERDDRELDLAAVEEGESRLEPVRIEIDLDRGLAGELERRGREPWRASPRRKHLDQRLRPEVLVDVDDRHARTLAQHPEEGLAKRLCAAGVPLDRRDAASSIASILQ